MLGLLSLNATAPMNIAAPRIPNPVNSCHDVFSEFAAKHQRDGLVNHIQVGEDIMICLSDQTGIDLKYLAIYSLVFRILFLVFTVT